MGRWNWSNRRTTEECRSLSVVQMARTGVFRKGPGNFWTSRWMNAAGEEVASIGYLVTTSPDGSLVLRLTYTIPNRDTGEKTPLNHNVEITTTPCHFGGQRHWLRCPLVRNGIPCGKRVGKLYLPPGGRYFGCRQCHNLTYQSCQEHDKRVDALLKLPPEALGRVMESGRFRTSLLALKAALKVLDKYGEG